MYSWCVKMINDLIIMIWKCSLHLELCECVPIYCKERLLLIIVYEFSLLAICLWDFYLYSAVIIQPHLIQHHITTWINTYQCNWSCGAVCFWELTTNLHLPLTLKFQELFKFIRFLIVMTPFLAVITPFSAVMTPVHFRNSRNFQKSGISDIHIHTCIQTSCRT